MALLAEADKLSDLYWLIIPIVGFFALLLTVAIRERRYTRSYVRVPTESVSWLSPYVRRMSDDALAAEFVFGDYVAHSKPSIKICGTVWMSRDGRTLLVATSGTVSGLRSKQTFLYSPLNDGTYLCTTDNIGESDPSGMYRFKRVWNGLFSSLSKVHQNRLQNAGATVTKFRETSPFTALDELCNRRIELMVNKGLAHYIDPDQVCWRHSFLGALHICKGFFVQLGQAALQFWRRYMPGAGAAV